MTVTTPTPLKYLQAYPQGLQDQVRQLIAQDRLTDYAAALSRPTRDPERQGAVRLRAVSQAGIPAQRAKHRQSAVRQPTGPDPSGVGPAYHGVAGAGRQA